MRDYWGFGKAARPMLPMIAIPTTAGTGSEAQSYALISDAATHVKMACGDPEGRLSRGHSGSRADALAAARSDRHRGLRCHLARGRKLRHHAAHAGIASCSRARRGVLLAANFERVLRDPCDLEARGAMLLGAHYAGIAIENSMLGATHACANPLTAHYGTTHGVAIAALLPHVVRWNLDGGGEPCTPNLAGGDLAGRLAEMRGTAGLPSRLRDLGVPEQALTCVG